MSGKIILAVAACVCVMAMPGWAQDTNPAPAAPRPVPPYGTPITLEQAKTAVAAAEAEAKRMGVVPTLAVVEPSGEIVLLEKGTGTSYGTAEVALEKARSAARFRAPTANFDNTRALPPGMVSGLGGIPIVVDGRIIGAIGTAGAPGDSMAKAAVAAVH